MPQNFIACDRPRRHHEEVLHVGVVAQQRVAEPGGDQRVLDFGVLAPAGDGRVRRRFGGDLHHVLDAGADSAGDDVELLLDDRLSHEHYAQDALHGCVDARRNLKIPLEDIDAVGGERGGFLCVSDDYANRNTLFSQQAAMFLSRPCRRW